MLCDPKVLWSFASHEENSMSLEGLCSRKKQEPFVLSVCFLCQPPHGEVGPGVQVDPLPRQGNGGGETQQNQKPCMKPPDA